MRTICTCTVHNFAVLIFAAADLSAKNARFAPCENFPLYSTLQVSTQNQETQKLDDTLRSFWELESFGILPSDKTIYDDFCVKIKFCDRRYEVSLPWRDPYCTPEK